MKTKSQISAAGLEPVTAPAVKIIGIGSAGVAMVDALNGPEFAGAEMAAVNTDAASLAASSATVKIQLETRLLRGLGTGGDPERGRAIAEEHFATLKTACAGAEVVFVVTGLGGGAGSGISPVLARAAKESGALVLAFATLPFLCEGNRRQQQALAGLDQLRAVADGVICLPCQKTFKLIDENTSVLDTFRLIDDLLLESVRGVWRLLTRPGLIRIHFDDLCALVRDRHSESVFASAEVAGPARAREIVEKLIAHPLLDEGRALAESGAVLVSLMGGRELTMAEVNRVMEQITRQCERAQIIMGAGVDETLRSRLSVTVIASKPAAAASEQPTTAVAGESAEPGMASGAGARLHGAAPLSPGLEPREHSAARQGVGRPRKAGPRMRQTQLPLAIISKGRFDKSEPTLHKGEDLDIPTYLRRGIPLN